MAEGRERRGQGVGGRNSKDQEKMSTRHSSSVKSIFKKTEMEMLTRE